MTAPGIQPLDRSVLEYGFGGGHSTVLVDNDLFST